MTDLSLSVTLSNEIVSGDDWLKLSQKPFDEKLTSDFMSWVRENQQSENPVFLWDLYAEYMSSCNGDGGFDTTIIVETSRRDLPYKLVISHGTLSDRKIVTSEDGESFNVSSFVTSYDPQKRYASGVTAEWEGDVFIAGGETIEPPTILISGGLLIWSPACLGTIRVNGVSEHDEYTATILAREGEYEDIKKAFESTVRAFWADSMAMLEISPPDMLGECTGGISVGFEDDTCVKRIIEVGLCDGEIKSDTTEPIPCPE